MCCLLTLGRLEVLERELELLLAPGVADADGLLPAAHPQQATLGLRSRQHAVRMRRHLPAEDQ